MNAIGRRSLFRLYAGRLLAGSALAGVAGSRARAADKSVTVGIDLSLTGADAETAVRIKDGFMMAIDEANAKGGPSGYHINVLLLDDGTATAGQYDPAQAAVNVRKMVADATCVAALGPMSSTPGKAMSPILVRAVWQRSRRPRRTWTSPIRNSPGCIGRRARRCISARTDGRVPGAEPGELFQTFTK